MKKILHVFFATILCLILASPATAYSATIKLNKTKLTLNEGQSYTLKLSGTSKTVKWSTSNKKVATVSQKGIVKAVSPGSATITAKVSNKKYQCKVTVKEVFNSKKAIKSLESQDFASEKGVIQIVKNNYSFPMQLDATIVYYDSGDLMLGTSSAYNYYFEKGKECVFYFYPPVDKNFNTVPYDHYKISYYASPIKRMKSNLKDIKIDSNIGADNVMVEVTNDGNSACEFTLIYIIFYKDGEIVDVDYQYADVNEPGSVDYLEFSFPYDDNFETVEIDDYSIYVNYSYLYE